MKRKTYGVPGQLECKLIIHNGMNTAEVDFRGGSIKDIVRCPARFSTNKMLYQSFIENSAEFKAGKIVLLDTIEIPDDEEEIARKAKEAALNARQSQKVEKPAVETPVTPEPVAEEPVVEQETIEETHVEEETSTETSGKIKVADKREAVEWLKEHYPEKGYTSVNLRTKAAFEAACSECGVEFEIAE